MTNFSDYDLTDFTPFLLNIAAEATSAGFQQHYKAKYGMLRTEWRVVFHLGQYGPMHAKDICDRARIHKTKVSRAVAALEKKRFLLRDEETRDKRHEVLSLTRQGRAVFRELFDAARTYDAELMAGFTDKEQDVLKRCLAKISNLE